MNRKDIIAFCNDQIFPQVKCGKFAVNLIDVVKMVEQFRRNHHFPKSMTSKINNGFLYINDIPVGRIALREPKVFVSDKAAYYEGKILRRCGL